MFICVDQCIERYDNWAISRSYGPCEICGKTKECYDIPSKYLKLKPPKITEEDIAFYEQWLKDYMHQGFEADPNKETFTDDFGHVIINVHRKDECNKPCTIHAHSEHKLADKPLLWRNDRGIFEHMCEHGIGHPCPDSLPPSDTGIHGCDGCCSKG